MIRRRRIPLLALILLLALSPAAFAAEGDAVLFERSDNGYSEIYPEYAAVVGDRVYVCSWEDLYAYKLGDEEPVKLLPLREEAERSETPATAATPAPVESIEGVSEEKQPAEDNWRDRLCLPFAYQGKLHMIFDSTGEIMAFEDGRFKGTGAKIEVPASSENYSISSYLSTIFEFEDKLYALVRVDMDDWDAPMELWIIDPATGGHESIKPEFSLKSVCGYEPGKLLGWTQPEWNGEGEYKEEDFYPRLFVLDAATGKTVEEPVVIAEIAWGNLCGPAYDSDSGMIYYALQNKLMRKSSLRAEGEVVSYFTRQLYQITSPVSILSGTHLVFPTYEGIFIRNIETGSVAGRALRIANSYMSDMNSAFMRANPDIPLEIVDINGLYNGSADEIAQLIGSGEDSVDIYYVSNGPNVRALIEKGYALDLSGSEAILRAIDRMYEPIREAISADGKPMAFPISVYPSLWSYNKEKFDELGLEYPATYSDYLDLYERWRNELKDKNPSITFTIDLEAEDRSESDIKMGMFYSVMHQYAQEFEGNDGPIKFNTPEFLEVMRKIEALPGEFKSSEDGWSYSTDENFVQLLQNGYGFEIYSSEGGVSTPGYIPRISSVSEPGVGLSMGLLIVNPNSSNVDNAIKYLEYMTEHGEHSTMLAMYPDFNEPLRDEWAVRELENAEKRLAEAKAVEVTDENRRDVEEKINEAERWVEQMKSHQWRISQESIDKYRALVEESRLFIYSGNNLFSSDTASKEINDLIERFTKGQINLDQMVRELDQKMQMIYLEQQ